MPTADGGVSVRPLPPHEAGHAVDRVFAGLSAGSRYQRFHGPVPRMTELLRRRLVDVDGHRRAAIVAEVTTDGGGGDPVPVGLVELADAGRGAAEVAIAVVDAWHRRGVGRQLIEAAAALAMRLGYTELRASALPENVAVRRLARALLPAGPVAPRRRHGAAHGPDRCRRRHRHRRRRPRRPPVPGLTGAASHTVRSPHTCRNRCDGYGTCVTRGTGAAAQARASGGIRCMRNAGRSNQLRPARTASPSGTKPLRR